MRSKIITACQSSRLPNNGDGNCAPSAGEHTTSPSKMGAWSVYLPSSAYPQWKACRYARVETNLKSKSDTTVPVTIYNFPSLEPRGLERWSSQHLQLPIRRDLLHRAVIFEGDSTRQGTASSKTRWEVHGSRRKLMPQKGMGRARVGSKQSPIRRGGGKAFGPHPRDFSTGLPQKIYDKAWRTALSYRYGRGELFVVEDGLDLPLPEEVLSLAEQGVLDRELEDSFVKKVVGQTLGALEWGRRFGRTLFVTSEHKPNLFTALDVAEDEGRALQLAEVDVKDLLETGRVVIERTALRDMIQAHQSDLVSRIVINGQLQGGPPLGEAVVQSYDRA
jgi:large subunit ribosomal protein L4